MDENNNYLIYYLDTKDLIISHKFIKEIGSSLPVFSSNKSQVRKLYESLNTEPSPNFQKSERKKKVRWSLRQNELDYNINLIYTPSSNEEMSCIGIIQGIRDMIYHHLVKSIPSVPIFSNKEKKVIVILFKIKDFDRFWITLR